MNLQLGILRLQASLLKIVVSLHELDLTHNVVVGGCQPILNHALAPRVKVIVGFLCRTLLLSLLLLCLRENLVLDGFRNFLGIADRERHLF